MRDAIGARPSSRGKSIAERLHVLLEGEPKSHRAMYQLEVKASLVAAVFPPSQGWTVCVDIDSMERCNRGVHPGGNSNVLLQQRITSRLLALESACTHNSGALISWPVTRNTEPLWWKSKAHHRD